MSYSAVLRNTQHSLNVVDALCPKIIIWPDNNDLAGYILPATKISAIIKHILFHF